MGKIVWLASYPKSGNTWLRAFLHNLLRNPPEGYDINQLKDFTLGDSQASWFNLIDPRPMSGLTLEEVAALRPKVHEAMTKAFPDTVFVKTHNALVEHRGRPMITMQHTAGAIYVVRNPLDLVISHSHHFGLSIDETIRVINTAGVYGENSDTHVYELHGSWSEHVASWTLVPNAALHIVRYEDMLSKPRTAFSGIAAFLGLRPPPERLARAIRLSSFARLRRQEEQYGFVERSRVGDRFFREGKAGQWHKALTPQQVAAIVAVHREQMARFGYWPPPESDSGPSASR